MQVNYVIFNDPITLENKAYCQALVPSPVVLVQSQTSLKSKFNWDWGDTIITWATLKKFTPHHTQVIVLSNQDFSFSRSEVTI